MKKRQGIRWKKFSGKQQNRDSLVEVLMMAGSAVLFDLVCALLFLHSSMNMVSMIYGKVEFSTAFSARALYWLLLICILLEASKYIGQVQGRLLRLGVVFAGTFGLMRWAGTEEIWNKLMSGCGSVLGTYLEEWNAYFGSEWQFVSGNTEYSVFFLEVTLLIVMVVLLWMAKIS